MDRKPISTVAELSALDDAEMVEGYRDGFVGEPEPGNNRSLSYWHGWRNGASDKGHRKSDPAQGTLAREVVATGYLRKFAARSADPK